MTWRAIDDGKQNYAVDEFDWYYIDVQFTKKP